MVDAVQERGLVVPLSFANIYETAKINDPIRRCNMARTQSTISGGRVFRGRRRILDETLTAYLAKSFSLPCQPPKEYLFLSDLWFESAAEYSPEHYGFKISDRVLNFVRANPAEALFSYLVSNDEDARINGVRRFSSSSAELVARIEARRALVASEKLPLRKRAYGATLIIEEIDFILATGQKLGLDWSNVSDIGSSLIRKLIVDIPVLNVERELTVRLEDHVRPISENDLRDMAAFTIALPLADVVVGENLFVNLARQAQLGDRYETTLLTSVFDLSQAML